MKTKEEVLVLKEKWHKEYVEDAVIVDDEEDISVKERPKKLYKQGRKLNITDNLIPNEMGSKYNLIYFEGTKKYRSVFRAMRRGRVEDTGDVYPKRPFNNRKNKPLEDIKRNIYFNLKRYDKRIS